MTLRYLEHEGIFDRSIVAALWSVTSGLSTTAPTPYRVLPDGCLDLVLRVRSDEPDSCGEPDLFISRPARTANLVAVEPGMIYLGVRFQPGRGGAALRLPAADLTGSTLSGDDARAALGSQTEMLRGTRTVAALRARLATILARQTAAAKAHPPPDHARAALALLRRSRGLMPIAEIALRVGISERTLHRFVSEAAGIPPKVLGGIFRFRHALALVRGGLPLAQAAAISGYSDQAHMTRVFRALGGFTPASETA